jgi:hypothetical protein
VVGLSRKIGDELQIALDNFDAIRLQLPGAEKPLNDVIGRLSYTLLGPECVS